MIRPVTALCACLMLQATGAETARPLLDPSLSAWEVWMGAPHSSVEGLPAGTPRFADVTKGTPLGLGVDPKAVFRVGREGVDDVLRISGEIYAGLTTKEEFGDFHLRARVRWGEKRWPPRADLPRDSGLLYHGTGPHGAFWGTWLRSVEFQVQERDFGDLIMLAGTTGDVRFAAPSDPKQVPLWDPNQPRQTRGRVRRARDRESPFGDWTTVEIYALGQRAIHVVNGEVVLAIENIRLRDGTPLTRGRIQLQSEAAEVFYRDITIRPIARFPLEVAAAAGFDRP